MHTLKSMILASVLAPFAQATSVHPALPIVEITPDNVEITEAGVFSFESKAAKIDVARARLTPIKRGRVKIEFDRSGKPVGCAAEQEASAPLATAICPEVLATARFAFDPGFGLTLNRGFVMIYAYIQSRPKMPPMIGVEVVPGYENVDLRYAPDETPVADRLVATDGRVEIDLSTDDYPAVALRAGREGKATVLLGVVEDGRVVSCRPLRSSGTAALDNVTCRLILRRAHYQFTAPGVHYAGVRYADRAVGWRLPH